MSNIFCKTVSRLILTVILIVISQASFAYLLDLRVPTDTKYTYVKTNDTYLNIDHKDNNYLEKIPNKLVTIDNYAATLHATNNTNMGVGLSGLDLGYTF